jgi:hypothetical protein
MAQPHLAGQRLKCPNCGSPLVVPIPKGGHKEPREEDIPENIVSCQCGQSFKAAPHLAGKRVPCPSCGQPIDIPGGGNRGSSESQLPGSSPATPTKQAARVPQAAGAKKRSTTPSPVATQDAAAGTHETDSGLQWDDALASPIGTSALDSLGTGPAYAPRRMAPEPIEPMTIYAMWIGGGAVVLLILVILGHIIWNAFAARDRPEPVEPAHVETDLESPPAEPGPEAVPASPAPTNDTQETSGMDADAWRPDAGAIERLQAESVELLGLSYRPPKGFQQIPSSDPSHVWAVGSAREPEAIITIIPNRGATQGEELRQQVFAGLERRPGQMQQEFTGMVHEPFKHGRLASGLHVAGMRFTARPQVGGQTLEVTGRYYVVVGEDSYVELVLAEMRGDDQRLAAMEATALTIRTQ